MSYPHQNEPQQMPRADEPRSAFAGPRLDLPRFQFAPSASLARPTAEPAPVTHRSTEPAPDWLRPSADRRPAPAPAWQAAPTAMPTPIPQHAPRHPAPQYSAPQYAAPQYAAPQYAAPQQHAPQAQLAYAAAPAPESASMPVAAQAAPRRVHSPVPVMQNTTTRASVSWDRVPVPAERTLLQRVSPVHMGVLMVMVMIVMVMSSGPAAMSAKPTKLPALASGGGATPGDVPMPVRAGATAVDAVTATPATAAAKTPAAKAPAAKAPTGRTAAPGARTRARMLVVGSARLRANVRSGGIPSPAAAANLAIAGGGRVSAADTGSVRMGGIPSAAASEQLGPQKLPFRPSDGVTLPRMAGERDNHAVDRHYGNDTLPMEEPALPAMTPGAAAERAERQVQVSNLTGGSSTPAPVSGGLVVAH